MFQLENGNENEYGGASPNKTVEWSIPGLSITEGAAIRGTSPWFIPSVTFARAGIGWALIRHLWLPGAAFAFGRDSQWSGLCTAKSVTEILSLHVWPRQKRSLCFMRFTKADKVIIHSLIYIYPPAACDMDTSQENTEISITIANLRLIFVSEVIIFSTDPQSLFNRFCVMSNMEFLTISASSIPKDKVSDFGVTVQQYQK